jgi:carboxypeptidase C (cathepsin A)
VPTVSFLRIYEAGHEVPFYQPKASLAMFERTLAGLNLADGNSHRAFRCSACFDF